MNLPKYLDLDLEYFIERARNERPMSRVSRTWKMRALEIWSDYQKFYSQKVELWVFVPCSVKLEKPEWEDFSKHDELGYDKAKKAYEQSGKPLEKPDSYDSWLNGFSGEHNPICEQYHEAEQRTLFTGWTFTENKNGVFHKETAMVLFFSETHWGRTVLELQILEEELILPLNESNPIQKLFLSEVKV